MNARLGWISFNYKDYELGKTSSCRSSVSCVLFCFCSLLREPFHAHTLLSRRYLKIYISSCWILRSWAVCKISWAYTSKTTCVRNVWVVLSRYYTTHVQSALMGVHSHQDLIWCVKMAVYMLFCAHRRSLLLCTPVIVLSRFYSTHRHPPRVRSDFSVSSNTVRPAGY